MHYIVLILLFCIGLAFGSFANVVIMRLRSGENGILSGRSHCPRCNHFLSAWDLIPLFSWLFLRGKCRYCHAPIAWRYPLMEFLMGLLFVGSYLLFYFQQTLSWFYLLWVLIIAFFFFIIFIYDFLYMEIPDEVSLPAIVILFAFTFFPFTPGWQDALLGAAIPCGFFGLQYLVSKGTWVGEGDFRLGALMGIILGWKMTILALFFAYILGAFVAIFVLVRKKKTFSAQLPFGPFLILGTLLTFVWGEWFWSWYWGMVFF